MGLFDKFLKKPETSVTYTPASEHEAWIGILMACMTADGDMDGLEIDALARMLALKQKFRGVDLGPLLNKVMAAKSNLGGLGLVEACSKVVNVTDRPTLFVMAVEVVLADGSIDRDEEMVIEAVAKAMEVADDKVQKIIEVMMIRNNGNVSLN